MRNLNRLCLLIVLTIVPATVARAEITAFWQRATIPPAALAEQPALADMQTWDLVVTTDGNWASAGLRATMPVGQFFWQHPLGGLTGPRPDLLPIFPALEFDTFAADPAWYAGSPIVLGGFPENQPPPSDGGPTSAVPGVFSMSWGNLAVDPPGTYRVARLTFPQGVFPSVHPLSNTSSVNPNSTTIIAPIPEPAASIFAAGAYAVLRGARRRRR
jgi:hypothetical protein